MCMYIYIYIYICIRAYTYVRIHYTGIYIYIYIYIYIHVYTRDWPCSQSLPPEFTGTNTDVSVGWVAKVLTNVNGSKGTKIRS